jgi:hypothetical protein
MSTQSNLTALSVQALVKIINGLVEKAEVSTTWQVSRKWTKEDLITHLDALCNEFPEAIWRVINEDERRRARCSYRGLDDKSRLDRCFLDLAMS